MTDMQRLVKELDQWHTPYTKNSKNDLTVHAVTSTEGGDVDEDINIVYKPEMELFDIQTGFTSRDDLELAQVIEFVDTVNS